MATHPMVIHSRSFASIRGSLYPIVGICGYSGAGKTTLIEAVVPKLAARGLKIVVVKQDAHGLSLDREGKDTDRLFRAGADVVIRDSTQAFFRNHDPESASLDRVIANLGPHYDAILVEGHKLTPLPYKVWLCRSDDEDVPPEVMGVRRILRRAEDREAALLTLLEGWMAEAWRTTPVYAGMLIGGMSRRMGRPKHLIAEEGTTWIERIADILRPFADRLVLLGAGRVPPSLGDLPVLPDADDTEGPMRGLRAAMRWAPRAGWLFAACDLPEIHPAAVEWLLSHRQPGVRAVLPVRPGCDHPEPLLAYYDFRMAPALEQVRRPIDLAGGPGVIHPRIPEELAGAWRNVNTPADRPSKD